MGTATKNGSQSGNALAAWQTRLHTITCPSGQQLRIRIPGVETILEHGDLPESLIEMALKEITRQDGAAGAVAEELPTLEPEARIRRLAEFGAFQRELVAAAVMEIADGDKWEPLRLTGDEVRELPDQDVEMVAMIVLRIRSTDARGVTVGVEPIDRWARFHETHGIDPASCPSCQAFVDELSTADVGPV